MDGSIESIVATNMSDALVMLFPTKALQPSRLLWIFQDSNFAAFLSSSFADEQKLSVKAFCLSLSLSLLHVAVQNQHCNGHVLSQ